MPQLKRLCENLLLQQLSLHDLEMVMRLAFQFNAHSLKHSCFEYIFCNFDAILYTKLLDGLETAIMEEVQAALQNTQKMHSPYSRNSVLFNYPLNPPEPRDFASVDSEKPKVKNERLMYIFNFIAEGDLLMVSFITKMVKMTKMTKRCNPLRRKGKICFI